MPSEAIPFATSQTTSGSQLGGAQPLAMNVVLDAAGAVRRRPGLALYSRGPEGAMADTGVEALATDLNGNLYGVSASPRRLYLLTGSGSSVRAGNVIPGPANLRTQIAATEGMLALTAGNAPVKYLFSSRQVSNLEGDPPQSTHIIAQGARLLSNNREFQGQVAFSSVATGGATDGHEVWAIGLAGGGFFSAESRPDPIVALHENTNELFVFGTETLQVFVNDPVTVYAPGSAREHGCAAPYSVIKRDQSFAWLDHRRRFVVSDGRTVEPIGDPVQSQVDALADVSDCYGMRLRTGYTDVLLWVFPSGGVALAFSAGGWSQWASWDESRDAYALLKFSAAVLNQVDGAQVVGTTESLIGKLDERAHTDRGERIKAEIRTGFEGRGTHMRKRTARVLVKLRRGDSDVTTAPVGWLSWRDSPNGGWRRVPVSFGRAGDREAVVPLSSLGTYRQRQWRWEFAEDHDMELVGMEETFELGGT